MRGFAFVLATAISLLAISDADARARGPERVGNMKRIIVPDKGEPETVIGTNGQSSPPPRARANARATNSGPPQVSNPTPSGVPVRTIIDPALRRGGPGIIP
jgi:hypothetical protein